MKFLRKKIMISLLFTLPLTGCLSSHSTVFPPPFTGSPQEISTYEVKGLHFVNTVSFSGMFAEEQLDAYMEKNHYRYYVVTRKSFDYKGSGKRISAMVYK